MQTAKTRVRDGRATTTVAAAGPGAYTVAVEFDPPGRLVAGRAGTRAKTSIRDLSVGSTGADVVGLTRKLDQLNIHVPPRSLTFSDTLTHAVIAFQKVTGLPRTGAMTTTDWQQLARTKPVRATQTGPPDRIEVDKTRQILIKVVDREVAGVLPVSTGRTGNTPEGIHQIRWKAPSSTTWLGPGILYRPLTFVGNSFAIHGWAVVPTYPASAGCVRIPISSADWLYDGSPVGETVIVHR